jgi:hypothetical protein
MSSIKRESKLGQSEILGYTEKFKAPFISLKSVDHPDLPTDELKDAVNVTVTAVLGTGKTLILRDAVQVDDADTDGSDASISYKFEGNADIDKE